MLNDEAVSFSQLLGIMSQLIKQLLTWYLTNCDYEKMNECVFALVCFNDESEKLGASARCHLKYDSDGVGVVFKKDQKPENKYTGRTRPTSTQMNAGVLQSQQCRSEDLRVGLPNIAEQIAKKRKRIKRSRKDNKF